MADTKDAVAVAPQQQIPWTSGRLDDSTQEYWQVLVNEFVVFSDPELNLTSILSVKDATNLQKSFSKATIKKVVLLQTLFIPATGRKKGRATEIVKQLEYRANTELHLPLAIGPITDETNAMMKICSKRNYSFCMPFSQLQKGF